MYVIWCAPGRPRCPVVPVKTAYSIYWKLFESCKGWAASIQHQLHNARTTKSFTQLSLIIAPTIPVTKHKSVISFQHLGNWVSSRALLTLTYASIFFSQRYISLKARAEFPIHTSPRRQHFILLRSKRISGCWYPPTFGNIWVFLSQSGFIILCPYTPFMWYSIQDKQAPISYWYSSSLPTYPKCAYSNSLELTTPRSLPHPPSIQTDLLQHQISFHLLSHSFLRISHPSHLHTTSHITFAQSPMGHKHFIPEQWKKN